jgi:hypothetical protein
MTPLYLWPAVFSKRESCPSLATPKKTLLCGQGLLYSMDRSYLITETFEA